MRQVLFSSQIVSAGTQSQSINLEFLTQFSIQINITSTSGLSGVSVKLQASNDNSNFIDIPDSSVDITSDVCIMINERNSGFKWVRVAFVVGAGSFTAEAIIAGRERW